MMGKNLKLSGIAEIVIALVIVNHIVRIIMNLYYLSSGILDIATGVWSLIAGISMIIILSGVLKLKRWAWYSFIGIQAINVLVLSLLQSSDALTHMFVAVVMCAVLRGLLAIKRDGVSAWDAMFEKESKEEEIKLDKSPVSTDRIAIEEDEEEDEGFGRSDYYVAAFVVCIFIVIAIIVWLRMPNA